MLRYLEALLRYKARFTLILIVLPAIATAASVVFFPTYKGSASLWAESPSYYGTSFVPVGWNQYLSPAQNEADSLGQLIKTASFAGLLVSKLEADGYVKSKADRDTYLGDLATKFTMTTGGTHLLILSTSCDRPVECLALLKETIAAVKQQAAELERDQSRQGIDFLQAELTQAKAGLKASEDSLQSYVSQHPGVDLSPNAVNRPAELDRLLSDVQDRRSQVAQIQVSLGQAQYYSSASATLLDTGPRVIDQPRITRGGLTGDGSSIKRGLIGWGVFAALGAAYLWLLVWVDKTARDPAEIERHLKVRVVATVPLLGRVERL